MTARRLTFSLIAAVGVLAGCGDGGEKEPASGDAVTPDALEACLTDEGMNVQRFDGAPIRFPRAGTFTPQAVLVHSPAGGPSSVPRQDIMVLEQEHAESYDRSLPTGVEDKNRFGANVLVLVSEVSVTVGPDRFPDLTAPVNVRRALNTCVS